jgi:hypothetical protein
MHQNQISKSPIKKGSGRTREPQDPIKFYFVEYHGKTISSNRKGNLNNFRLTHPAFSGALRGYRGIPKARSFLSTKAPHPRFALGFAGLGWVILPM